MPSYRFCRPDDIPALVRAVDACYGVHFPSWRPMTVEDFRAEMKTIDLWPSNSMMAIRGDEPIAVMLGTKRADEVMVLRIGVRPDHLRQGHGGHLLTSLSQKLAVLGPERLIAELPVERADLHAFFAACGYAHEADLVDYKRPAGPAPAVPDELVTPVTVAELLDQDLLEVPPGVAWNRQQKTLANRKEALQAAAIATPEHLEAWIVWDPSSFFDVLAAGCRDDAKRAVLLGLLLRWLANRAAGEGAGLRMPRLLDGELPASLLGGLGFGPGEAYQRWAARAQAL